jgi:hypothetical protein
MWKHKDAIAIDFDDTFTADPEVWSNIIRLLQLHGYTIICATSRKFSHWEECHLKENLPIGVKIVFCGNKFKRPACKAAGYNVTIWIDDTPEGIGGPGILWLIRIESFLRSTKDWILRKLHLK